MKLILADRLQEIQESSTLKMNAIARQMAAQGKKVINLTAGEPDFPVLPAIKKAATQAIADDFSKYTPVAGIPELRKGIAEKLKNENGLNYAPEDIVVSVGAKQAVFHFLLAVINPGDEVIIPAPYWVSYPEMVKIAGGIPVILPTRAEDKFKISADQLKKAITKKTKAFIFNSPSNPTGTTYTGAEVQALAKALEGTNVWVLSDEIYEKLVYGPKFSSFGAVSKDAFERTITVNGFSKTYAMTGWRLGYAAGPKALISAMAILQGQSTSNAASIVQKAALEALKVDDSAIEPMKRAFVARRDRMMEILSQCKDFSFVCPDGAFYLFLNVERVLAKRYNKNGKVLQGSEDLAFFLLEEMQVVTVPGDGFGAPGFLRLSFAVADHDVEEGAKRLVTAVSQLA